MLLRLICVCVTIYLKILLPCWEYSHLRKTGVLHSRVLNCCQFYSRFSPQSVQETAACHALLKSGVDVFRRGGCELPDFLRLCLIRCEIISPVRLAVFAQRPVISGTVSSVLLQENADHRSLYLLLQCAKRYTKTQYCDYGAVLTDKREHKRDAIVLVGIYLFIYFLTSNLNGVVLF